MTDRPARVIRKHDNICGTPGDDPAGGARMMLTLMIAEQVGDAIRSRIWLVPEDRRHY